MGNESYQKEFFFFNFCLEQALAPKSFIQDVEAYEISLVS